MFDWRNAFAKHEYARKLALKFDASLLRSALGKIKEEWWKGHLGPYHDGAWEMVSLWAPNGNLFEQRSFGGAYSRTVATLVSPYFWDVMQAFPCEKNRVRLMRLKAGGRIFLHSDPLQEISRDLIRLHIPITTNPEVQFTVNGHRLAMCPGEVWHVDVRFPHEVRNLSEVHRVHMVLDLQLNSALDSLLEEATSIGSGSLLGYYVKHALPKTVKTRFSIGN